MDRIKEITEFLNYSQTREQVLEKYVDLPKSKDFLHKKLQDVFWTHWASRILGLETFLEFYEALVKHLKKFTTMKKENLRFCEKSILFFIITNNIWFYCDNGCFLSHHGNNITSNDFVTK